MFKKTTLVLSLLILVLCASLASATVTISTPEEGAFVGPSTRVTGTASQYAFLVVYSEVYEGDTGEWVRNVPGIRHWTNEDNSFNVRIATPRLIGDIDRELKYIIKVKAYSSPELTTGEPDLGMDSVTVYSQ